VDNRAFDEAFTTLPTRAEPNEVHFVRCAPIKESGVISYYCIVNMPGVPAREIEVLDASDDRSAITAIKAVAHRWIGFDTIELYHGERVVKVLSNPSMGFPTAPLPLSDELSLWDEAA